MKIGFIPLAVALLGFTVSADRADAAWTVQTVDNTVGGGIGGAPSLVLSSQGVPHISYYRPNASAGYLDLYYATKPAAAWDTEAVYTGFSAGGAGETSSIVLTDQGNPAVIFSRATTFLDYSIRTGGAWSSNVTVATNAGAYSSLLWHGTEAAPQPVAAYYDGSAGDLRYAYFSGMWNTTNLDSAGDSGRYCSMAQLGSAMGIAYVDAGKLGFFVSLNDGANWGAYSDNQFGPFNAISNVGACALALAAPTATNAPAAAAHIIYYNSSAGGYFYETNDTENGLWATPQLIETVGSQLQTFQGCSIAVGSDGVVRVAYFDFANRQLRYAERKNGVWTSELVSSALGGANCMLRLTSANVPCIAYTALSFDGANYNPAGLAYATVSSGSSTPGSNGTLSFQILGKSKIQTAKSTIRVKGTASSSAVAIQWRIGKKSLKKVVVSGGSWKVKVKPLPVGKTKVSFRAVSASGETSGFKKVVVLRGE